MEENVSIHLRVTNMTESKSELESMRSSSHSIVESFFSKDWTTRAWNSEKLITMKFNSENEDRRTAQRSEESSEMRSEESEMTGKERVCDYGNNELHFVRTNELAQIKNQPISISRAYLFLEEKEEEAQFSLRREIRQMRAMWMEMYVITLFILLAFLWRFHCGIFFLNIAYESELLGDWARCQQTH